MPRRGARARLSRWRSAISRGVSERVRGVFAECGIGVLRQDVAFAGAALHGTVVQEGNKVACVLSRFRAVRPPRAFARALPTVARRGAPRRETPRCVGPQMRYSVRVAPILHYVQHNAAPYQRSERDAPRQDGETGRRGDGVSGARSNRYALRDRGLTQSVSTAPGQRFVRDRKSTRL